MGNKSKGNPIKLPKGMSLTAMDYKGNVYFTEDGGRSWIMHTLDGKSQMHGALPPEHFVSITEGR
jgi:hypothetical protein